ncbi:hypothetical protein EDB92DRAFT_207024 [Lactarius akahatsu]|uniref:DUF6535 domain-containing protein n=1 Tax=Lactarius akahatsu TaxID=416441 RepID=A0AAD4LK33_9AGAM|nr:hypothetical protein EDB92DRAFT_207024 [Lactarius akahatsu]
MPASAPQQSQSQNACCCTAAPKETTYSDSSGAIFSMYIDHAQKFDDENVENWKGGAESILVFTGIFSATVATFIAMSYPNLQQDPNVTTQSLLIKISQQLANPVGAIPPASPSDQSSFAPSASVVFVNSVWFLSLVLSLTCALIATLLQQWARRYLQMIRRNHPPHDRAHIREYFSRGARRFRIFALVEALPFLLLISVLLFFAGLVAFAFLANRTAACFTAAIVGFCILSYIALTLMPLTYHDCPYHTPFTSLIWYTAQLIPLSWFSFTYHCAKAWYYRWGATGGKTTVELLRDRQEKKLTSFSEGRTARLERSAKRLSMDIYKKTLVRTLNWLSEDLELGKFISGIPGLCESEALATKLATRDNPGDTQLQIRNVLAALPGPVGFHPSLPWSIIQLAQRAIKSKLPESKPRTVACLKALYYIPGAIRDLLAPYAAEKKHSSKILPLLDSPESLEIINELQQKASDDDIAIPVRCVAAVIAAYVITSPPKTPSFIGGHESGKNFLKRRLHIDGDGGAAPEYRSDSARRLQNIVYFLRDIRETLGNFNRQWWTSNSGELIRKERIELFTTRRSHTKEYSADDRKFDQQLEGDRGSPGFVSAAQLDLITLTLEILVRDPITDATHLQRDALRAACEEFKKVAFTLAGEKQPLGDQLLPVSDQQLPPASDQGTLAWIEQQAADGFGAVETALESLWPQTNVQESSITSTPSNGGLARARNAPLPPSPLEPPSRPYSGSPSSSQPFPKTSRLDIESRGSRSPDRA